MGSLKWLLEDNTSRPFFSCSRVCNIIHVLAILHLQFNVDVINVRKYRFFFMHSYFKIQIIIWNNFMPELLITFTMFCTKIFIFPNQSRFPCNHIFQNCNIIRIFYNIQVIIDNSFILCIWNLHIPKYAKLLSKIFSAK